MEKYWIFVASEYSNYNHGSIKDILNKLREEKIWRIGNKTVYKNNLKKGDKIIFYITGTQNKYFIAKAELASEFIEIGDPINGMVYFIKLEFFKKPVYIKPLLNQLSFIKNKKYYGLSLQNGIVKTSKKDFFKILKKTSL